MTVFSFPLDLGPGWGTRGRSSAVADWVDSVSFSTWFFGWLAKHKVLRPPRRSRDDSVFFSLWICGWDGEYEVLRPPRRTQDDSVFLFPVNSWMGGETQGPSSAAADSG
jgi:hypothetical protein